MHKAERELESTLVSEATARECEGECPQAPAEVEATVAVLEPGATVIDGAEFDSELVSAIERLAQLDAERSSVLVRALRSQRRDQKAAAEKAAAEKAAADKAAEAKAAAERAAAERAAAAVALRREMEAVRVAVEMATAEAASSAEKAAAEAKAAAEKAVAEASAAAKKAADEKAALEKAATERAAAEKAAAKKAADEKAAADKVAANKAADEKAAAEKAAAAAGKALVGKSVRIAPSAESAASVRRYDGCTGMVTRYDMSTDCCDVDVGTTTSSSTLEDLEGRIAELTAAMETVDITSPELQLLAQELLGGLTVPVQLLEIAVIPQANVVLLGVVSLEGSRFKDSSDGAAVAVDPLSEREQLMLLEEVAARLRSEGEFQLGRVQDVGPPTGSGVSAPAGPPGDTPSASGSSMPPPPSESSMASGSSMPPPPSESSSAASYTGGKRKLASGNVTAPRPWGELVRIDHEQAAAEITRLVSASMAGIGIAPSIDDAAMLELFKKKTTETFHYAVGFKPRPAFPADFAERLDHKYLGWLERGHAKLVGAGYAATSTRQLSPSADWHTYPLEADVHTATNVEQYKQIMATLAACSDHQLREFAFIDKLNKPCWTALCASAAELDAGRSEQAWAFNVLSAHDQLGDFVHGQTPSVRPSVLSFQARLMLDVAWKRCADATIDGVLGRAMLLEAVEALAKAADPTHIFCYSLDNDPFYQRIYDSTLVNAAMFRANDTEPLLALFSEKWPRTLFVSCVSSTTDTTGSKPLLRSGAFNRKSLFARLYGENDGAPLYAPTGSFSPHLARGNVLRQMLEVMQRRAAARNLPQAPTGGGGGGGTGGGGGGGGSGGGGGGARGSGGGSSSSGAAQQPPTQSASGWQQGAKSPITPGEWGSLSMHAIQGGADPVRVRLGVGQPGAYSLAELRSFESISQTAKGVTPLTRRRRRWSRALRRPLATRATHDPMHNSRSAARLHMFPRCGVATGSANNPFLSHPKVLAALVKLREENPNLVGWGHPSGYGRYKAVAEHLGWPDTKEINNFFNNYRR